MSRDGCKKLSDGMVDTKAQVDCFMYVDDSGCMQQGEKVITPNADDPTSPVITYSVDGVAIPKPDKVLPCLEAGTTQPVFIMGGKIVVEQPECPAPTSLGVITDMTLLD